MSDDNEVTPDVPADNEHHHGDHAHRAEKEHKGLLDRLTGDDHEEASTTTPGRTASTAGETGAGGGVR